MSKLLTELYRVLRDGGTLIMFYDLWKITTLKEYLEQAKFNQIRFIEWLKTNPVPLNGRINYLTTAREIALVAVKKGKGTFNSKYDNGVIKTGEGFGGYPDWIYETFDAKISIRYDHAHDYKPFSVGTFGLCISCADEIDEGLYCDNCKTWETCDCCNERCHETWLVHNHDGYEIYVCESCLEDYACCEHCDEYFLYDDMTRIDDYHYVCQQCLEEHYELCDCCDEYYLTEEMYDAVDQYGYDTRICENCRDDYYLCDECNRYVHADDAIEATNSDGDKVYLCPECRNRDYQECDNCKGIFHEVLIEDDICPDCHAHQEEEKHSEVIA